MNENYLNMRGINVDNIWFFVGKISSRVPADVWETARAEAVRTLEEVEAHAHS